ncbi:MAG: hypothetical protein E7279_02755 [Lachnospiraceae bacterium]|nr:hypothetical protein [Lachnospiraceae bacterium]
MRQINSSLPLLLLGIVIWGCLVQLVGIWFVEDKLRYSTGTWIGVSLAVFMAINLALVIESAVDRGSSVGVLRFKSIFRYLVVIAVFFVMIYFNLGNWISAFIAVMGLKVSAYAQPFIIKIIHKERI